MHWKYIVLKQGHFYLNPGRLVEDAGEDFLRQPYVLAQIDAMFIRAICFCCMYVLNRDDAIAANQTLKSLVNCWRGANPPSPKQTPRERSPNLCNESNEKQIREYLKQGKFDLFSSEEFVKAWTVSRNLTGYHRVDVMVSSVVMGPTHRVHGGKNRVLQVSNLTRNRHRHLLERSAAILSDWGIPFFCMATDLVNGHFFRHTIPSTVLIFQLNDQLYLKYLEALSKVRAKRRVWKEKNGTLL